MWLTNLIQSFNLNSGVDVIALNDLLNEQLTLRQARPDGVCPIRRELANQCFG